MTTFCAFYLVTLTILSTSMAVGGLIAQQAAANRANIHTLYPRSQPGFKSPVRQIGRAFGVITDAISKLFNREFSFTGDP